MLATWPPSTAEPSSAPESKHARAVRKDLARRVRDHLRTSKEEPRFLWQLLACSEVGRNKDNFFMSRHANRHLVVIIYYLVNVYVHLYIYTHIHTPMYTDIANLGLKNIEPRRW